MNSFNNSYCDYCSFYQADDETVVAGMVDGLLSVRRRDTEVKETKAQRKKVSYRYADLHSHVSTIDTIVQEETKEIMAKQDVCLRKFQYSKALDSVLLTFVVNRTPHVTVALLQELTRRQGLKQALAGRDGKSLSSILRFLIRYIGNIRFGRVLLHVTSVLIGEHCFSLLLDIVGSIESNYIVAYSIRRRLRSVTVI